MAITKDSFYELLNNPELVNDYIFADIENIANDYRFFNSAYLLLAKKINDEKHQNTVLNKRIALNVCDRNVLHDLLSDTKIQVSTMDSIVFSVKKQKEEDLLAQQSQPQIEQSQVLIEQPVVEEIEQEEQVLDFDDDIQGDSKVQVDSDLTSDEDIPDIEKVENQTEADDEVLSFADNIENVFVQEPEPIVEQETQDQEQLEIKEPFEEDCVVVAEILEEQQIEEETIVEEVDPEPIEKEKIEISLVSLDEIATSIVITSEDKDIPKEIVEESQVEAEVQEESTLGNVEMFDNIDQMFLVDDNNQEIQEVESLEDILEEEVVVEEEVFPENMLEISNLSDIEEKASNEIERLRWIAQRESSLDQIETSIKKDKKLERYKMSSLSDMNHIAASAEKDVMLNVNSVDKIAKKIDVSPLASLVENKELEQIEHVEIVEERKVSAFPTSINEIKVELDNHRNDEIEPEQEDEEPQFVPEPVVVDKPKEIIERTIELSVKGKTDRSLLNEFIKTEPLLNSSSEIKIKLPNENDSSEYTPKRELLTESLANIYVRQKKYLRAVSIFNDLILKYPEKKHYFAQKIKEIENLM